MSETKINSEPVPAPNAGDISDTEPAVARASTGRGGPWLGLVRSSRLFVALVGAASLIAVVAGTAMTELASVPSLTPSAIVRYGIPAVRLVLDLAAVAAVGLALLPKLLGFDTPDVTGPILRRTYRPAVWAAGVWLVAALASIVLLAAELVPGQFPTPAGIWNYTISIAAGKGLAISAACALLLWWLCRLTVRFGEAVPAELRAGVALFGLLPLPLTGHASNWYYHDLTMVSMELHVTASAAWMGGLVALVVFLAGHRELLAVALPRFSTLATWCVFIVGLTGIANGLLELYLSPITTLPSSIVETRYGVMVLAKAACLAAVAVIALRVRSKVMPAVTRGRRSAFAAWCGWEIIVLGIAFGLAVVLTRAEVTSF